MTDKLVVNNILFQFGSPTQVKSLSQQIKNSPNFDKSNLRKMIKVALGSLQHTLSSDDCIVAFENICKSLGCRTEQDVSRITEVYAGVVSLLMAILRVNTSKVRQELLLADIIEQGFPETFAIDLCRVGYGSTRLVIDDYLMVGAPCITFMKELDWRIELTSRSLPDAKLSFIILTLTRSDDTIFIFKVSISKFHQLRFTVASLLQQMNQLKHL